MNKICIITARGGSKRIPKKNIKEFCGKPIIAYSIEAALKSKLFDEVMVSTDDIEIAEVAKKYGASVPFMRSEKNSNDFAGTKDVILEVLDAYKNNGRQYDCFCCLYPTAPFITSERLMLADEILSNNADANGIMSVVKFSFPPQRGFIQQNSYLNFKWPKYKDARSQDLIPMYHDAGQFYIVKIEAFYKYKTVIPTKMMLLELDELEVQDIDNISDWEVAEFKYSFLNKR